MTGCGVVAEWLRSGSHHLQAQDLPHQSRSADDWPHTRRTSGWLQHHHTMAHHSFSPSHKHQESYESYCLSHRTRYFQNWQPLTCFFRRQHRKLRSLPCLIVSKLFLSNDGKHSEVYVTQCTVSLTLYIGEGDSKGGEVDGIFFGDEPRVFFLLIRETIHNEFFTTALFLVAFQKVEGQKPCRLARHHVSSLLITRRHSPIKLPNPLYQKTSRPTHSTTKESA